MRISDWSSDVCSSDLFFADQILDQQMAAGGVGHPRIEGRELLRDDRDIIIMLDRPLAELFARQAAIGPHDGKGVRSEEHTSELQSLMRISYAVFCLKKKKDKVARRAEEHNNELHTLKR